MLNYAENIKEYRKIRQLTQSDLADGITSQGMISKIEKKQLTPDIDLLEAVANKLEVSLTDLLYSNDTEENQMYDYMNTLVSKREYLLLERFFVSDPSIEIIYQKNPGYYYWIEGIILSQNYEEITSGIEKMEQALNSSDDKSLKVRILIGLSGLLSENNEYNRSIEYLLNAIELSETIKIDYKLVQKINFQLARLYSVIGEYNEAVFYSRMGIQYTIENDSLYLLDDMYLLLADTYLRINELQKADRTLTKASTIAEVKSNTSLMPFIEKTQSQIKDFHEK